MENLAIETLFNIMLPLSYEDIINLCLTNKQYMIICNDENFW